MSILITRAFFYFIAFIFIHAFLSRILWLILWAFRVFWISSRVLHRSTLSQWFATLPFLCNRLASANCARRLSLQGPTCQKKTLKLRKRNAPSMLSQIGKITELTLKHDAKFSFWPRVHPKNILPARHMNFQEKRTIHQHRFHDKLLSCSTVESWHSCPHANCCFNKNSLSLYSLLLSLSLFPSLSLSLSLCLQQQHLNITHYWSFMRYQCQKRLAMGSHPSSIVQYFTTLGLVSIDKI